MAEAAAVAPPSAAACAGLWNRNFLLLWQGQLVSSLGDVVYEIALGFWVLAATGSTAVMGALMAATALPRILVSPAAGVWVDRADRRLVLAWSDMARGLAVVLVGAAALAGRCQVWMVFAAGTVMGLGGAFFNPAVGSVLPDIVKRDQIVRANSVFGLIGTSTGILGNSAGGLIYQFLGPPLLFLFNGLSYIYAGAASLFIRVPKVFHAAPEFHFWKDFKGGLDFVWRIRGLRDLILLAAGMNLFGNMGFILILPMFQKTAGLGPARYGLAMAVVTAGFLAGLLALSALPVPPKRRFAVFNAGLGLTCLLWALFPLVGFYPMLAVGLLGAACNSVVNTLISSVMQMATPADMRGKVFSLMGTVTGGLMPLGMALGGVLAEFLPVRLIISACMIIPGFIALPLLFSEPFRRFIGFDPAVQTELR
jgi:MFS family permease